MYGLILLHLVKGLAILRRVFRARWRWFRIDKLFPGIYWLYCLGLWHAFQLRHIANRCILGFCSFCLLLSVQGKIKGPLVRRYAWKGLSIGEARVSLPAPMRKCPKKLQIRQLFQYKPLSDELREKLHLSLKVIQPHLFILPVSNREQTSRRIGCDKCEEQLFHTQTGAVSVFLKKFNCFIYLLWNLVFWANT